MPRALAPHPKLSSPKRPFNIDEMLARIRRAIQPFKKAAMFELFDDGYTSVFEQLIACGYVHTRSPEQTQRELETKLPKKHWVQINALLVPFGKHICTGPLPKCSTCPVLNFCRQVGVTAHR